MLWIKTLHILFVMAWMAGLFYMPRILVHYVEGKAANEDIRRLVVMANRLWRFSSLMAVLALIPGIVLWLVYGITGVWMWIKLGLVILLLLYHGQCWRFIQKMNADAPIHSSLFFRIFNESALIIVIPILIMVVLKPI